MGDRVTFSGQQVGLSDIVAHHQDLESSLHLYFSAQSPAYGARFTGYTSAEVVEELGERILEADLTSSLVLLASVEAAFRIDYLQRCYRKKKDPVSRAMRAIYKSKARHATLDEDIFEAWVDHSSDSRPLIGELRGAFKFRHWLAHGRYWTPKLGRRYEFDDIFQLAQLTLSSFPFCHA